MTYQDLPSDAEWVNPDTGGHDQLLKNFGLEKIPDLENDKEFLMYSKSTNKLFSFCYEMFTKSERIMKDSGWQWVEDTYS